MTFWEKENFGIRTGKNYEINLVNYRSNILMKYTGERLIVFFDPGQKVFCKNIFSYDSHTDPKNGKFQKRKKKWSISELCHHLWSQIIKMAHTKFSYGLYVIDFKGNVPFRIFSAIWNHFIVFYFIVIHSFCLFEMNHLK